MLSVQHHHLLLNEQSRKSIPLQQVCMASDMGLETVMPRVLQ